jgi:DNA-binding transcriptional regulator YdaS (Cro superfamily)
VSAASWDCDKCGQRNSGWSNVCGRCETYRAGSFATPPAGAGEAVRGAEVAESVVRAALAHHVQQAGSQKAFAESVGASPAYVNDVLHGRRAIPEAWVSYYRRAWVCAVDSQPAAPTPLPEAVRELPGKWRATAERLAEGAREDEARGYLALADDLRVRAEIYITRADELDRALTGGDKQGEANG